MALVRWRRRVLQCTRLRCLMEAMMHSLVTSALVFFLPQALVSKCKELIGRLYLPMSRKSAHQFTCNPS
eukprot:1180633-Prorocentrum_minimum.AAC.1